MIFPFSLWLNNFRTLLPTASMDSTSNGISSVSSITFGFPAYQSLDNNSATYWSPADGSACWWQYQFFTPRVVKAYYLDMFQTRTWVFQGSNDGINWVTLDSITSTVTTNQYNITNNTRAFYYYRISFTIGSLGLKTLQLYGY